MRKYFICACAIMFLLLCGCNESYGEIAPNTVKTIDMSFESFSGENNVDILDFINNPQVNNLYPDATIAFRFKEKENRFSLHSISVDGEPFEEVGSSVYCGKFDTNEYCSKVVCFLCNQDEIKRQFYKNGIENVENIVIINLDTMEDAVGYVVAGVTENNTYYMTVPLACEEYGEYIFGKIYTSEEFLDIYSAKSAKVFIDEKEASFSSLPLLGNMLIEMDVFEFIKALGYEYTYNDAKRKICFENYTIQFKKDNDSEHYDVTLTCVGDKEGFTFPAYIKYKDGRYIGDYYFYITVCNELGYNIDLNYNNYSIHITSQKT